MNPFKRLLNLLPQRPLQVGTVLSVGGGVCRVQLPGGGEVIARGDQAIGTKVFVRDGAIEGVAPSLAVVEIEV